MTGEWIKFIISTLLITCGVIISILSLIGIYKFKFVLNRMHSAAMNDTLGILLILSGLMVQTGLSFTTLKMALVIIFLWFAGPVSSHLIARLEITTDESINSECKSYSEEELDKLSNSSDGKEE